MDNGHETWASVKCQSLLLFTYTKIEIKTAKQNMTVNSKYCSSV